MIAEIQTNVRHVRSVKTDKGSLIIMTCESETRDRGPYLFEILSSRDGRKPGVQKLKVNIENKVDVDGKVQRGFKVWEVTE